MQQNYGDKIAWRSIVMRKSIGSTCVSSKDACGTNGSITTMTRTSMRHRFTVTDAPAGTTRSTATGQTCSGRPSTLVMRKASAPERQTGATGGVPATGTPMPIGTRTTAIAAITFPAATTTTTSARVFVAATKMAITAVIDMGASLAATISWRITF